MPHSQARSLTAAEIALARSVFGDSIDYSDVRMVLSTWWPFQPRNAAMAPCGNVHFHPAGNLWSEDFSKESISLQGFWIHEMVHVWQAQRWGRHYLPLMRHPLARYRYDLKPGKPFARYGLEQQAETVRHHFLADRGWKIAAPPRSLLPFCPEAAEL